MITIYCDVVFVINFVCDYVLLYVTARFLNVAPKTARLLLSSFAGGVFSLFGVILLENGLLRLVCSALFSVVMCRTAFGKGTKGRQLKIVLTYNAVSCVLCGVAVAVSETLTYDCRNGGISVVILFVSAALLWVGFIYFGAGVSKEKNVNKVEVQLCYNGKERKCSLLCDSGNLLTDPYSSLPVIILKSEKSPKETGFSDFVKNKTRYIPIKTAEGNSVIKAVKPEYVRLSDGGKIKEINAILGFSENENADFGGTDGLIPYSLIKNI